MAREVSIREPEVARAIVANEGVDRFVGEERRSSTQPRQLVSCTWLDAFVGAPRAAWAPCVERRPRGARLRFRRHALPAGFELRAHAPREAELGRALVAPATGSPEGYQVAVAYVLRRVGG